MMYSWWLKVVGGLCRRAVVAKARLWAEGVDM